MSKKRWLMLVVIILVAGLSYLAYFLLSHQGGDPLTVSELKTQAKSVYQQSVRVKGRVAPGSVAWDNKAQVITFALTDEANSLDVVYQGLVPDEFKPGVELVLEGEYRPDGTFEARRFGQPKSVCRLCH